MRGMVIDMNDEQLKTLADLQGFLEGTVTMDFAVAGDERYGFIARTVKRFGYGRLKRSDKAIVLRFLERVSGYSRQQIARLVKRGGELIPERHGNGNAVRLGGGGQALARRFSACSKAKRSTRSMPWRHHHGFLNRDSAPVPVYMRPPALEYSPSVFSRTIEHVDVAGVFLPPRGEACPA